MWTKNEVAASDMREIFFDSKGTRCAADFYLPANIHGDAPCVIMTHRGSGTKRLGLPRYAEKFLSRGLGVLVFDYRHFGSSEGSPRQIIDVVAQKDDYRAAISLVRNFPGIDKKRVALWGTSLSGGQVLAVAASDPSLAADPSVPLHKLKIASGAPFAQTVAFASPSCTHAWPTARRGRTRGYDFFTDIPANTCSSTPFAAS